MPDAERRNRLISLLQDGSRSSTQLAALLGVSDRVVRNDLAWLRCACPTQMDERRDGRSRTYHMLGLPPTVLPRSIDTLTHDELTALIAARGLLRAPEVRNPGWERPASPYAGELSAALHGLLERAGLDGEAKALAPTAIAVSRFAMAVDPPGAIAALLAAITAGDAVHFRYRNRRSEEHDCHVLPLRLVFIRGEAHCFAWSPTRTTAPAPDATTIPGPCTTHNHAKPTAHPAGSIRQYRCSRITSRDPAVTRALQRPPGCPARPDHTIIDDILATGFNATGSADQGERLRIVVAIHDSVWPDITGRTWGEDQHHAPAPDRGPAWHRLEFLTSGLLECRLWILSHGAAAIPENPPELVAWHRDQAERMAAGRGPADA
jgi:hypothetical protein